jgi:hypothetical protein
MKISKSMVRDHLRPVTMHYFVDHDMHPTDVADYIPYAAGVRDSAEEAGDLPWLKLGLEHVLTDFTEHPSELNGGSYAFNDGHMRDLIEIIWETLWPAAKLPEDPPTVELEEMSTEEWQEHRKTLKA